MYESKLQKAIAEEFVEVELTKFSIHGPAGSGKTCLQHLLLNEPSPEVRESTNLVTGAVLSTTRDIATSVMTTASWGQSSFGIERVDEEKSLHLLAHQTTTVLPSERSTDPRGATPISVQDKKSKLKKCLKSSFLKKKGTHACEKVVQCDSVNDFSARSLVSCGVLSILPAAQQSDASLKMRWIYGTDSGGQPAYQDIAPAFLRHCSIVILTIK